MAAPPLGARVDAAWIVLNGGARLGARVTRGLGIMASVGLGGRPLGAGRLLHTGAGLLGARIAPDLGLGLGGCRGLGGHLAALGRAA